MKKNEEKTNAIRSLEQKKIDFVIHNYTDSGAVSGEELVAALNEDPNRVFKTLVTIGKSNNHYVFLVPVSAELDLKKAAGAVGEKNVEMIKSKDLLPLTGYVHGGCSPVGMKKFFKTVIDVTAENFETIMFSGGKIGLQVETSVKQLEKVIPFSLKDIKTDK
ncbi:MAG: Cys-tRNA(Pro) deacylase [Candidatus Borkfalkiaceae bacterium]|nr:Cys-tRNA(Pro) deacylase [Christensenellaceae bacterium]